TGLRRAVPCRSFGPGALGAPAGLPTLEQTWWKRTSSMVSRYDMYSVRYPLLPLKNVVIFPRNVVTLLVGRTRSIQAVEEAMSRDRRIVVVAHRDASVDDPRPDDLYQIGTLAEIVSIEHQQG